MSAEKPPFTSSPFLPLLLLVLTVVSWSTFQSQQLARERETLRNAISGQEAQMEQSMKVRGAMESLAARTARLARAGNANATVIVEELRKRGIAINADGPAPAQAPSPTP